MIDDKKIESAKEEIYEDRFLLNGEEIVFNNDEKEEMFYKEDIKEAIGLGAKWGINELLKELFHPASEVPRNDNGKVLAFSKEIGYRKLYDMNDELDKTTCDTYQEMWEEQVYMFKLSDWIFVDELFDLTCYRSEGECFGHRWYKHQEYPFTLRYNNFLGIIGVSFNDGKDDTVMIKCVDELQHILFGLQLDSNLKI